MDSLPATYTPSRIALHSAAEHVLAPALHAATGRIGLRIVPGGFGTPPFEGPDGTRQVAVVDGRLAVITPAGEDHLPLTTLGRAAAFVGVAGGAPTEVYTPVTPYDPDAPLEIDPVSVTVLADWFALVDEALEVLRSELDDRSPAPVQLWPEHFDEAFDAAEVNYGGSPGDDEHDEPYLYVGPWSAPRGPFWNESFGASRSWSDIRSVDAALDFLREGAAQA